MAIDRKFQEYFTALDRAGNEDRCFLCRRSPAEVKAFFGFHEDGTPIDADRYGLEDVALEPQIDIMSYRGTRPVCAVCQLNFDTIFLAENGGAILQRVLRELESQREKLWGEEEDGGGSSPESSTESSSESS